MRNYLVIIFFASLIISCGSDVQKIEEENNVTVIKTDTSAEKIKNAIYNIPDSINFPGAFNRLVKIVADSLFLSLCSVDNIALHNKVYSKNMVDGWNGRISIYPLEFRIDSMLKVEIINDTILPLYFKKSILRDVPAVYLLMRTRSVNYSGNSYEDGGLSKDQVGKTYNYGNYRDEGLQVSFSFLYFEPKIDNNSKKYVTSCLNNETDWFGYFEIGRIDQATMLNSIRVLRDKYRFIEKAPSNLDINYSKEYFNYINSSDDISFKIVNSITNLPLNENYKGLFKFLDVQSENNYFYFESSINSILCSIN